MQEGGGKHDGENCVIIYRKPMAVTAMNPIKPLVHMGDQHSGRLPPHGRELVEMAQQIFEVCASICAAGSVKASINLHCSVSSASV